MDNCEDYEKQDLSPYFDVANKNVSEMQYDMDRWIKVTEKLIDQAVNPQSFEAKYQEQLRDEESLQSVLDTCINMTKITPEMRAKLIEIEKLNSYHDGDKKTSVFR